MPDSRSAAIVLEHATEALVAHDGAAPGEKRLDEFVVQPLVIPLSVIMGEILVARHSQRALAKQNQPIEALFLDRRGTAADQFAILPSHSGP